MANDVLHLFMYIFLPSYIFFGEAFVHVFCQFLNFFNVYLFLRERERERERAGEERRERGTEDSKRALH